MKLIGLTGGIGSGKSTVATIFKTLGIPVYESDQRAKYLMNSAQDLKNKIIGLFGSEAYSDSELNTSMIAAKVFHDPDQLSKLNAIVHPAVYKDLLEWSAEPEHKSAPYLIQESAILFEEDLTGRMKGVILVVAPEEIRLNRVINRDNVSIESVQKRMKLQWPEDKKIPLSDYVIFNDEIRSVIEQVLDINQMILADMGSRD